jgi:hypothetical protein
MVHDDMMHDGLTMLKTRHVISFRLANAGCTVYCRAAVLFLYRVRVSPGWAWEGWDNIYIDK